MLCISPDSINVKRCIINQRRDFVASPVTNSYSAVTCRERFSGNRNKDLSPFSSFYNELHIDRFPFQELISWQPLDDRPLLLATRLLWPDRLGRFEIEYIGWFGDGKRRAWIEHLLQQVNR